MRAVALAFLALTLAIPVAHAQDNTTRQVAYVVPIDGDALFGGDGRPLGDAGVYIEVAQRSVARLMARPPEIPFALAVSGVFCDELRAIDLPAADALLRDIRRLAAKHDVVTTNYTQARLHDVPPADLPADIADGANAIERCIGKQPMDVLAAPDGAPPDADALDVLAESWPHTILTAYASPPPPDGSKLRYLPTVSVDDRPGAPAVVAETMDERSIDDDTVEIVPVRDLAHRTDLSWTTGEFYEPPTTSTAQQRAISNAATALGIFEGMTTDDNPLRDVFRTVLARIRGAAGQRRARDDADAMVRAVARVADRVRVDDGSVTFTSRSGDVPVTISNANDFPVSVKVELLSSKVDFEQRVRDVVIDPPGDTITFAAEAKSSGSFPITVRLVIRRQGLIDDAVISVRSTAVNISAVVLTAGGALYVAYWLIRRLRRTGFRIAAPPEDAS